MFAYEMSKPMNIKIAFDYESWLVGYIFGIHSTYTDVYEAKNEIETFINRKHRTTAITTVWL